MSGPCIIEAGSETSLSPTRLMPPICPRCGYDLAGLVASWRDSCPLASVCSECGLAFEWRNVMRRVMVGPDWSFEQAHARTGRALLRTVAMCFAPWRLWGQLRMHHAFRLRRLVILVLASLGALHAAWAALAIVWRPSGGFTWIDLPDLAMRVFWPYGCESEVGRLLVGGNDNIIEWIFAFGPPAFAVLVMLVFRESFRRQRLRRAHLWREAGYGLVVGSGAMMVMTAMLVITGYTIGPSGPIVGDWLLACFLLGVYPASLIVWWWCFLRKYLQLHHAVGVLAAKSIIAFLATFVAFISIAQMLSL